MKNPNYKNKNIAEKYLNNMQKNQFLNVKNSLLELEKDFIELKDRVLKNSDVKIKGEIEQLFCKLIIVSIDDMDKFEQKEMKKIRAIKNTWYDWLINYIPETIRKCVQLFSKIKLQSSYQKDTLTKRVWEKKETK